MENTGDALVLLNCTTHRVSIPEKLKNMIIMMIFGRCDNDTSYEQLNFIKQNISKFNLHRLLETNPDVERNEIIDEHFKSSKPTVLISPSLHLGLDLKDDLSRFQIITKVPYPSLGDRWIDEKRKRSEQWYSWQTGLRLAQAYGRSVRCKDDWVTTYVLDANLGYFISRNKTIMPQWFIDAISNQSLAL